MQTEQKAIQKKIGMTFFQDGLWDLVLGFFLLAWGLTVWLDLPFLPGAVFICSIWLTVLVKRYVTYPRIGYAIPAKAFQRGIVAVIIGLVVLLAVVLVLPLMSSGRIDFLRNHSELIFQLAIASAIALIGLSWKTVRWYFYALLAALFAVMKDILEISFSMSFLIPGGLILICGLIIFIRFLRKYPVEEEETPDEKR